MTLSLTNPVENLLKVTLLKVEQDQKDGSKESDTPDKEIKPDQNTDKTDEKNENEDQKTNEEEKDKDEKKDEQQTKEKSDTEQEKDSKKDSHVGVAASKKPNRSMDNSCESRSFIPTAEVKLLLQIFVLLLFNYSFVECWGVSNRFKAHTPIVQKLNNAIHQINRNPLDKC